MTEVFLEQPLASLGSANYCTQPSLVCSTPTLLFGPRPGWVQNIANIFDKLYGIHKVKISPPPPHLVCADFISCIYHSLSNLCFFRLLDLPLAKYIHGDFPWFFRSLCCLVLDFPIGWELTVVWAQKQNSSLNSSVKSIRLNFSLLTKM